MKNTQETDVLIIGAGMAGSCLARQLKLAHPELRITLLEAKKNFNYWVGESTVEAWEDYMTRVLKLGPFVEKNFVTKHGLRMFFDSKEKDLSVKEMSEFGRSRYHHIPARNLDRRVFDQFMIDSNKKLGIDVRLGVKVLNKEDSIQIDAKQGHLIDTTDGTFHCRWVVDAAGRASPIVKKYDLVEEEKRHSSVSFWSRVKGANWIDDLGDDEWKKRVNYTIRYNSTSHFMYDGYWFWLIPIDDDVVSIGVEGFSDSEAGEVKGKKSFEAFLRKHKCLNELLGDNAEFVDFNRMNSLPRCAKKHFSEDRWFLTGMSGIFVDVMGSGTSRLYSEFNRMVGNLIATDLKGDENLYQSQIKHFNIYAQNAYELHFRNLRQYDLYGSFDLWPNFFGAGLSKYFNSHLPNAISDLSELRKTCEEHKQGCSCDCGEILKKNLTMGFATKLNKHVREFKEFLDSHDAYYAGNQGQYFDSRIWEDRDEIAHKFYEERDLMVEKAVDQNTYRIFCERIIRRMCEIAGHSFDLSLFDKHFNKDWNSSQTLADLLKPMQGATQTKKGEATVAA